MKRIPLLIALIVFGALPSFAQQTEFGVIVGGSSRFADKDAPAEAGETFADTSFSFSNSSFELFWGLPIDDVTYLKFKAGRIETDVPVAYRIPNIDTTFRRDAPGEVQHVEMNVEYRFSEPFGSTGLFGGLGLYRQAADDADASQTWGANFGVNADFPITSRYGVMVEATYHWVRTDFHPRYLTVGAGLRLAF